MRRLIATIGAATLLLLGCGDDGGGSDAASTTSEAEDGDTTTSTASEGSDDEFCSALEGLQDIDPDTTPTEDEVAELASAAEVAPNEVVSDQILVLAELGAQLVDLDVEDQEAVDDASEAVTDAEVVAAAEALATAADEECGFDVPLFSSFSGAEPADGDTPEVDTDAVRAELTATAPEVEVGLLGIADFGGVYIASIAGLDPAAYVDACTAVSDAFVAVDPAYAGLAIQVADETGTVLSEGEAGAACAAA